MTARQEYPLLAPHDPDGTRLRTIPILLDTGDSLLSATTLTPVDANDVAIVGGDFTVEPIAIGLISSNASGDLWGFNYRLHDGADLVGIVALLRLRPAIDSQPSDPAYDQTYRVQIKQT